MKPTSSQKIKTKFPYVSVIIPVYNQEAFIGRCLRSLLHQGLEHSAYEIIVVNDGSTDRTDYALSLFVDPDDSVVRVLSLDSNMGLPAALNYGIERSRGSYIVRVDSDDFVNYNFLNFLYTYLKFNTNADAVACDYLMVDDDENVLESMSAIKEPIACGIMFKKEHLVEIGMYDESFLRHEERELRIRFEKKYKIDHLNIPLYRYRRHDRI